MLVASLAPQSGSFPRASLAAGLFAVQEECGGCIPFERFMRDALYHPDFGYYAARIREVGRHGDFSTWPTLDRAPARAVAAWLAAARFRHIIEVGAGNGRMAADVLRSLGWMRRLRTTYHIVEVSAPLRTLQQKRLARRRVVWHGDMESALRAAGGRAGIVSNELPDAFPCRVFVRDGAAWKELALRLEEGGLREVFTACPNLPESSAFEHPFAGGARIEIHEAYRRWLISWAGYWKSGAMLTIDYGAEMPELYHRRPAGTLRAYAHHHRLSGSDIYGAFGRRDITCDVNFTDLRRWGEALGWKTESLTSLGSFLADKLPKTRLPTEYAEAAASFQTLVQRTP